MKTFYLEYEALRGRGWEPTKREYGFQQLCIFLGNWCWGCVHASKVPVGGICLTKAHESEIQHEGGEVSSGSPSAGV